MHRTLAGLCVIALALAAPTQVLGQGLSLDVSAGRLVYDPLAASLGTSNLMASLRYDTSRNAWVYGVAAAPLGDGATFWGGAGTGGRFARRSSGRATVGADLAVHGYSFRDALADRLGTGGIAEAMPFARLSLGGGFVEGHAGWRGHTLAIAGIRDRRGVFETGARAGAGGIVRVEGQVRWVHASEGAFPSVGATVAYDGSPVQLWGHAGKWLGNDLDQATWGGGLAASLGARSSIWASVRQDAPDPLYWNTTRRTWSVGMTRRLGRVPPPLRPVPVAQRGAVLVTLRAADAPPGGVSVAGDFNNWQPTAMQREGDSWILRVPLAPGVYHYAFRSAAGDWFVPSSTPGRRDDGMGGHVAVLVVS